MAHTAPSPAATGLAAGLGNSSGAGASRIDCSALSTGSRRTTCEPRLAEIHTAPAPAASPSTLDSGDVVLTATFVFGSIRVALSSPVLATQIEPDPAETSVGCTPTGTVAVT
jgi:hypothetical protein